MRRLHYSKECKRKMTGRRKYVRRRLTVDQVLGLQTFAVMLFAVLSMIVSIAVYIGLL